MQLPTTDLIAIYGALVATIVFAWDILKWVSSGARLRATALCHVCYEDSRVISVSQTEHGEARELAEYCHIELTNIGDQPATLLSIEATHSTKRGKSQMSYNSKPFTHFFGKTLPHVLPPGEVWITRIEMPLLHQLAQRGKPVIKVRTSTAKTPFKIKPKFERNHG